MISSSDKIGHPLKDFNSKTMHFRVEIIEVLLYYHSISSPDKCYFKTYLKITFTFEANLMQQKSTLVYRIITYTF
jgi:hypothetical protein